MQNIHTTPVKGFTSINAEERKNLGIRAGDTVRVHQKIKEAAKGKKGVPRIRIQVFEGLVLSVKHGTEPGSMFTVRKVSNGVGIERIFPLYSPVIDKIEIVKRSKVRRSKLYYIREKVAKEIKRAMRRTTLSSEGTVSDAEYQQLLADEKLAAEEAAAQAEADAKAAEAKAAEEKAAADAADDAALEAEVAADDDEVEGSDKGNGVIDNSEENEEKTVAQAEETIDNQADGSMAEKVAQVQAEVNTDTQAIPTDSDTNPETANQTALEVEENKKD